MKRFYLHQRENNKDKGKCHCRQHRQKILPIPVFEKQSQHQNIQVKINDSREKQYHARNEHDFDRFRVTRKGNIAQQQQPEKQNQQQIPVNPLPRVHDKIYQEIIFYHTVSIHLLLLAGTKIWHFTMRLCKNRRNAPVTRRTETFTRANA
jgi:hypothetical protein